MIAIIVIGVLGGMKLDKLLSRVEFPVFTMVLTIISVIFATYYSIKDFLNPNK
jgi:F0F1-type ATP synthase assembly protein I